MAENVSKNIPKKTFCDQCSLQFYGKSAFTMHLSIVHKQNNEIKENATLSESETFCNQCSLRFDSESVFAIHLSISHKQKNESNDQQNNETHAQETDVENKRESIMKEICKICGLEIGTKSVLKTHNSYVHCDCILKNLSSKQMKPTEKSMIQKVSPVPKSQVDVIQKTKSALIQNNLMEDPSVPEEKLFVMFVKIVINT